MTLPVYTLERDRETAMWVLKDSQGNVLVRFQRKEDALKRGVLREVIGPDGGSVRILKHTGEFQEERTFPSSKDASRIQANEP